MILGFNHWHHSESDVHLGPVPKWNIFVQADLRLNNEALKSHGHFKEKKFRTGGGVSLV